MVLLSLLIEQTNDLGVLHIVKAARHRSQRMVLSRRFWPIPFRLCFTSSH